MNRIPICWKCIKASLEKIHLVDKCLILFMAVLLAQSAHNLLSPHPVTGELATIDVIVRTSCAAVFGYFISANFIRHAPEETRKKKEQETESEPEDGAPPEDKGPASSLQIILVTAIGLFCLLVLFLFRDIPSLAARAESLPSATATVAQLRDFVSGSVGFLIGCPTSRGKRE